jgi:hypothetical protein
MRLGAPIDLLQLIISHQFKERMMLNAEQVVSSWLNGSDSVNGMDNPAGSLFLGGVSAMEAAIEDIKETKISSARLCESLYTTCCPSTLR